MANVRVIPATACIVSAGVTNAACKKRVAAYARVSTDSEEQLTSYEAQIDHYTKLINGREDWEFVTVYTDEGISATTPSYMENVYTLDSGMLKSVITKGQFFLSNFASAQARYCDPYLHATKNSTNSSFSLDKRLVILYNTERYVEVSNTCLVKHRHA